MPPAPRAPESENQPNHVSYGAVPDGDKPPAKITDSEHEALLMAYHQRRARRHQMLVLISCIFGIFLVFLLMWAGQPREPHAKSHNHAPALQPGCESTVLLVRHCDKDGRETKDSNHDRHCSYLGYERVAFFTQLFGERWPHPSRLYALTVDRGNHYNFREWETLKPLSKRTGVDIELLDNETLVAQEYWNHLESGKMCGKVTVICWQHSEIPTLAGLLGCEECPKYYPENSFDQVWQLKHVYTPPTVRVAGPADYAALVPNAEMYPNDQVMENLHGKKDWHVYTQVTQQNFDALAFGREVGDYPHRGAPVGGKWRREL